MVFGFTRGKTTISILVDQKVVFGRSSRNSRGFSQLTRRISGPPSSLTSPTERWGFLRGEDVFSVSTEGPLYLALHGSYPRESKHLCVTFTECAVKMVLVATATCWWSGKPPDFAFYEAEFLSLNNRNLSSYGMPILLNNLGINSNGSGFMFFWFGTFPSKAPRCI